MLKAIFSKFRRFPKRTGTVWRCNGSTMVLSNWASRRFYGWTMHKPKRGDEIHIPMASGRTAVLIVMEVDHPGDPADMYFCTASDLGYLDEEGVRFVDK